MNTENLQGLDRIYDSEGKWNFPYLENNAEVLMAAGEYSLAKNVWKTLLHSPGGRAKAFMGMGKCLSFEGKIEEAVSCFEESIVYQPSVLAYRLLVSNQIRLGKLKTAVESIERALALKELTPQDRFDFHFACGNCQQKLKRMENAENHYRKALSIRPSSDEVQCNLATLYRISGKTDGAIRAYQDALASNPSQAIAWQGLGEAWMQSGNSRDAIEAFARSLEINPAQPWVVCHLLECAFNTGQYARAEPLVSRYAESAPFSSSLLYCLAVLRIRLGLREKALKTLQELLQIQPKHEAALEFIKSVKEDACEMNLKPHPNL